VIQMKNCNLHTSYKWTINGKIIKKIHAYIIIVYRSNSKYKIIYLYTVIYDVTILTHLF